MLAKKNIISCFISIATKYLETVDTIADHLCGTPGSNVLTKSESDNLCKLAIIFIYIDHVVDTTVSKK